MDYDSAMEDADTRMDGTPGAPEWAPAWGACAPVAAWVDAMTGADQAAYVLALDGRFVWVNAACEALFGRPAGALLRSTFMALTHPDDQAGDRQRIGRLIAAEVRWMQVDKRFVRPDGSIVWARLNVHRPWMDPGSATPVPAPWLLVLAREVGHDSAALEALQRGERQVQLALEGSRAGTWDWNLQTDIVEYSAGFARLLRYQGDDFHRDFSFRDRLHPADRKRTLAAVHKALSSGEVFDEAYRLRCFDGRWHWFRGRGRAIGDVQGKPRHFSGILFDWQEAYRQQLQLRRSQRRMAHLARHDPLTGLPNRLQWNERLQAALAEAQRHGEQLALLMMDLDRFKDVNDTLGHSTGDALLASVGQRLRQRLRQGDALARLGGDEFVVLMRHVRAASDAAALARELIETLAGVWTSPSGQELQIGVSVGIALVPHHGTDPQALMGAADAALYRAKALGRGTFAFFSQDLTDMAARRMQLESRLRHAVRQQALSVVVQPQLGFGQPAPCGAEALLRWEDTQLGPVAPGEFIPVAESCGLIEAMGRWVLEQALDVVAGWRAAGWRDACIAVNVSARQFSHADWADQVLAALAQRGLPGAALELEVTESALLDPGADAAGALARLRAHGVAVAIDDFGVRYSSLGYLQRLPVDTVKIDRSFVRGVENGGDSHRLCAAIVAMAHHLGLSVVAEGVETAAQLEALRAMGCDRYQGYWADGHPTAPPAVLQRWRTATASGAKP
ncbi:putative signaling protein [Tepidimonas thermarum]|uniref:Putative signaling protein n=1 Tax=Tepidimonas thermarum TaxID=335431 RepID=A0A554X1R3_9BURK|nr:GGDEF and EAL domain-containing protein [Tepidimonas thermarum]TSE29770.1 putative signaling protein [Tepidimonas thermarum]